MKNTNENSKELIAESVDVVIEDVNIFIKSVNKLVELVAKEKGNKPSQPVNLDVMLTEYTAIHKKGGFDIMMGSPCKLTHDEIVKIMTQMTYNVDKIHAPYARIEPDGRVTITLHTIANPEDNPFMSNIRDMDGVKAKYEKLLNTVIECIKKAPNLSYTVNNNIWQIN